MGAQYIITNAPERIDFEIRGDPEARAVQNAKNLLMTRMGEIPYDRQRGFDIRLYDLPIGEMQEALMSELDRVMLWEPFVEVVSAEIVRVEMERVLFRVTIEVTDNVE